jgi:hypothetical protein
MNDIDFNLLKEILDYCPETGVFTWKVYKGSKTKIGDSAGGHDKYGYKRIKINDKKYGAHRLAWLYIYKKWPDNFIDHINGIKDDNRICNLRDVTRSENMQNLKKPQGKNKYLGVYKKRNKWQAKIEIEGKKIHIGMFSNEEDAHQAYISAKKIHHPTAPH